MNYDWILVDCLNSLKKVSPFGFAKQKKMRTSFLQWTQYDSEKKGFFVLPRLSFVFFFGELGGLEWRSLLLLIPCASLIRSYRVLLGFTAFHEVLPGFTRFYWVLLGFTGFYQVST